MNFKMHKLKMKYVWTKRMNSHFSFYVSFSFFVEFLFIFNYVLGLWWWGGLVGSTHLFIFCYIFFSVLNCTSWETTGASQVGSTSCTSAFFEKLQACPINRVKHPIQKKGCRQETSPLCPWKITIQAPNQFKKQPDLRIKQSKKVPNPHQLCMRITN